MRHRLLLLITVLSFGWGPLAADSGSPIGTEKYLSASGEFELEVDPRWDRSYSKTNPLLTLRHRDDLVWQRTAKDFESFFFPMHVFLSDDGQHIVFSGYSVHNFGDYEEGLRFYNSEGGLVRFVSRLDLPPGPHSISTTRWIDVERTTIEENTLHFFTPGRDESIDFDIRTGEALQDGAIVPNQGDDKENWRKG